MDRVTNAQAALVAELIGDLAILVQRAESFEATMEKAREAMTAAAWLLESRLEPFKRQLATELEQTKSVAIKAFIYQTNQVAALELKKQTEAMAEIGRAVIEREVAQPLRQLAAALKALIGRVDRLWDIWLTHAATAAIVAAGSGWFVFHFFPR